MRAAVSQHSHSLCTSYLSCPLLCALHTLRTTRVANEVSFLSPRSCTDVFLRINVFADNGRKVTQGQTKRFCCWSFWARGVSFSCRPNSGVLFSIYFFFLISIRKLSHKRQGQDQAVTKLAHFWATLGPRNNPTCPASSKRPANLPITNYQPQHLQDPARSSKILVSLESPQARLVSGWMMVPQVKSALGNAVVQAGC